MLHQKMPPYEGSQPFLYACYCAEDEHLAFPIIARMYNEGFRIWCVNASGLSSDFRSMQRLGSASFVMMFMSRAMAEQLRYGNNECLAVAKSATLRTVVLLDDYSPSSASFASSTPDRVIYRTENDAPFWLYAYSADHFERCRGSWPSKKLLLREPRFSDVETDQLYDEYSRLESILGTVSKPEPTVEPEPEIEPVHFEPAPVVEEQPKEPTQERIVQPEDHYFYVPLAIIPIEKNEAERKYAELSEIITSESQQTEAEKEIELGEPSRAFNAYASLIGGKKTEPASAKESGKSTDTSHFDPENHQEEVAFEETMPKPVFVPDPEPEVLSAIVEESKSDPMEYIEEFEPEIDPECECNADNENVSVKILVRRPRRKKVSVKALPEKEEVEEQSAHVKIVNATVPFEKYIRNIALSAMESERERLLADPQPEPRTHVVMRRPRISTAEPVEAKPLMTVAVAAAPKSVPAAESYAPISESEEVEKPSPRKNRFPHVKGALSGVLAALRSERAARAEKNDEALAESSSETDSEDGLPVAERKTVQELNSAPAASVKIAAAKKPPVEVSKPEAEDPLRAAVNKFLELDSDESIYV